MTDHLHLLLMMNPRHALSEMVRKLKEASEQYLKETYLWEDDFHAFQLARAKFPMFVDISCDKQKFIKR